MTVVDSGICISALHFGGVPLEALRLAVERGSIAYCERMQAEVVRGLVRKCRWELARAEEAVFDLFASALLVEVTGAVIGVCRDAKDDMILECAINAHASFIVTGDKDLLTLVQFRGVRIVRARDYIEWPGHNR